MTAGTSLDALVRMADLQGEVDAGKPVSWLVARAGGMAAALANSQRPVPRKRPPKPPPWSEEEDRFLTENLGVLSEQEIATALGRSLSAVQLRWKRDLDLPAPSKKPGYLTGHGAAKFLCVDIHCVMELTERGILPCRRLPGKRGILQISRLALYVWAINPGHWIYFKPQRVRDPKLRRLIELRAERWGDEWWTTQQVADYYGLSASNSVAMAIKRGKLPAVRWANWKVKRSDALAHPMYPGSGMERKYRGFSTPRADAFLLKAREEWGLEHAVIGRMMKWDIRRVMYRYRTLVRERSVSVETEVDHGT